MRQFLKVSIILLLLIFLLCGCGESSHYEDVSSPNETITPVIPSPQSTPEPETSPTPVPSAKPGILDGAERIGDNLLLIPNEPTESAVQQQIAALGDNILAWSYRWNGAGSELVLNLISSEDGSTLSQHVFTGLEQANIQILNTAVAISDWADGQIIILDESLNNIESHTLGTQGAVYISPIPDMAYIFENGRGIKAVSLDSTQEERYVLDGVSSLYPSDCDGYTVGFSCISAETDMSICGVLDLLSGEAELCPFDGMFYGIEKSGDTWLGSPFGEENVCYVGADKYPNTFCLPDMSFAELLSDGRILIKSISYESGLGLSLYSSDGIYISSCNIGFAAGGLNCEPVWFGGLGGYFLDVTTAEGSDRLLFWDISVPTAGADLNLSSPELEITSGSRVSDHLYDMADELGDQYGIRIVIAELCDNQFGEFYGENVYDEEYIYSAMNALACSLRRFPDGFFDKLCYSVYSQTEIHLVGPLKLSGSDGSGFSNYVGAAVQDGTSSRIALDILRPAESIEQTLYHEISHLIEMRLEFDAENHGGSFSEEKWASLNPVDFSYIESRTDIPDSVYSDGFEGWFIDVYSRVNSSEDRGRIFEYYMMEYDWAFASSPERSAKLEYYLSCIYESFGSEGWEKKAP